MLNVLDQRPTTGSNRGKDTQIQTHTRSYTHCLQSAGSSTVTNAATTDHMTSYVDSQRRCIGLRLITGQRVTQDTTVSSLLDHQATEIPRPIV